MTKKKILIIEDEEILLDVLQQKLSKDGYEVSVARDGSEGLAMLKKDRPDLILLDIIMPKMDGYEVLEKIKNMGINDLPIIVISNSGQPVEIEKALSLGARDYLIKAEFEPNEVIKKVRSFLPDAESGQEAKKVAGQKGEILVVEDDQFLRDLLVKKLEKENYLVAIAIDGQEALTKFQAEKPKLVLLDIILPVIDGFEVLKNIRNHQDKNLAQTPVILLSNLGQETDIEKGKKLGANDYLIKAAFTTDEIIDKIKKYL
jgi:CheY-like chemotaxis protein